MKLTSVMAEVHVFDGVVNGSPGRFLLGFDNGRVLGFRAAGDGFRMDRDIEPFVDLDVGECGRFEVANMTQSLDQRLSNAEVKDVFWLKLESAQIGVQLRLADDDTFQFWVDGDELWWGDAKALDEHWREYGDTPKPADPVQI